MAKYFVSYVTEYPIYEPAEGGYYYAGTTVQECYEFDTWKKANRFYQRCKKEFLDYHKGEPQRINDFMCGGCGKWVNPFVKYNARYIGDSEWVELTREMPVEHGWKPYE